MLRTKLLTLLTIALWTSLSTGVTCGAAPPPATASYLVNYFENANTEGYPDGTVYLINPGLTGATVCANIYVFHPDQELAECCACTITPDGLTTLSINNNLTSNPLIGGPLTGGGVIVIVSTRPPCNPTRLAPSGTIDAWGTHVLTLSTGGGVAAAVTETAFTVSALNAFEESALDAECAGTFISEGLGICSCGATG
jgi:hypothetical protein